MSLETQIKSNENNKLDNEIIFIKATNKIDRIQSKKTCNSHSNAFLVFLYL